MEMCHQCNFLTQMKSKRMRESMVKQTWQCNQPLQTPSFIHEKCKWVAFCTGALSTLAHRTSMNHFGGWKKLNFCSACAVRFKSTLHLSFMKNANEWLFAQVPWAHLLTELQWTIFWRMEEIEFLQCTRSSFWKQCVAHSHSSVIVSHKAGATIAVCSGKWSHKFGYDGKLTISQKTFYAPNSKNGVPKKVCHLQWSRKFW